MISSIDYAPGVVQWWVGVQVIDGCGTCFGARTEKSLKREAS